MLHYIFLLFSIIFLNSTFLAFDPDKNNNSENARKQQQIDSDLQSSIFQARENKKILFALHIKKRIKQDLVDDDIAFFEEDENSQESIQAKLNKKLQKLREKLQPRQHAIVAESIVFGATTSGAGATITGATVAGFGAGCGAAGTAAASTATGFSIGGVLTGIGTFIGGCVTWPVVVTVAAGGFVIVAIADEAEKKNKLDQEEVVKRREQEKIELEKQRELEELRIKLEREKEEEHLRFKLKAICLELTKTIDIHNPGPCINIQENIIEKLGPCIYVPVEQGPQVCIYVPAQNDYPPMIYVPAEDDNLPFIYVLTKEEDKNLILHFAGPAILIPGGIVSGGTIPIIIGIGVGIGWIIKEGVPLLRGIKDKIKKNREEKEKGGGGGGGNNNKNDKDKDKKYPHGKYENNRKHHKNSPKNIGKPPIDGQKALDKSIKVPGKDYRLAVENGELIKFQEHSPGKYHGYRVDPSQKIIQLDKNILQESGLAKQLNKGNPYR